ncbi:hypothetical protein GOODEAATRI_021965, partial [Goodea atripinnis]
MELERFTQRRKPVFWSRDLVKRSQTGAFTIQAESDWRVENSVSLEQQRLDTMKSTQCSDTSILHPVQLQQAPPSDGCAGENVVLGGKKTADRNVETRLSFADESDKLQSLMKDDRSILMCLARKKMAVQNAEMPNHPVSVSSDPPTASCEPLNVKSMAEKSTFAIPCAPSCDATTNTETERCTSNHTQTEGSKTAEQHIMTELQMNDLDCLAE